MLFNSLVFLAFFAVVYTTYLLLSQRRTLQNLLLLLASYVFYAYWDWRFLSLLCGCTLINFIFGHLLGNTIDPEGAGKAKRRVLLLSSIGINLGFLCFFKYFNFFAESFADILRLVGFQADAITLNVILPLGISFFIFQTMSYTIDIYWSRLNPTKSLLDFALFVAFFPQLVAGPIERAANLLPQIERPRHLTAEQVNSGLFLLIFGYFKKVFVADNAGFIADQIFNNHSHYSGIDILIGALAFCIQIYGDFSGYSDIARGLARLMGFELMVNFRLPLFALNPSDFWQRWHISLSSWLRDYVYIPLGGNRGSRASTYGNILITMVLGGLWHGAAWNFVIWGVYHGLLLAIYRRFEARPAHHDPWGGERPYSVIVGKLLLMFSLTLVGWLIFRATSVGQLVYMLSHISLVPSAGSMTTAGSLAFFTLPLALMEIAQYATRNLLIVLSLPSVARILIYGLMLTGIVLFSVRESLEFIYFQF